jgi:TatA/E family protein of Tat protein translocase
MFEGLGPEKLIVILLIVLVLFGGRRIPEIGASLGKGIREFKKGMKDVTDPDPVEEIQPSATRSAGALPASSSVEHDSGTPPKRLIER